MYDPIDPFPQKQWKIFKAKKYLYSNSVESFTQVLQLFELNLEPVYYRLIF